MAALSSEIIQFVTRRGGAAAPPFFIWGPTAHPAVITTELGFGFGCGAAIGSFQALQHRMADMLIELKMARAQVYRALTHWDAAPDVRDKAVSSMKVQIGRSIKFIGAPAVQLHGRKRMTEEYLIGHCFKRLFMIESSFGTTAIHLDRMATLDQKAA